MYIKVKVNPGSKKEDIKKISGDILKISVREKAEGGRANARIKEILVSLFNTKNIRLVSGHTSPSKIFSIGD